MDKNNRWMKLGKCIPWDALVQVCYQNFTAKMGRPAKEARLVIGAVIIKHKLKLSDEETIRLIQENPYLQYFCGLPGFQTEPPFALSLFVEIRRRMGAAVFEQFHQAIIGQMAGRCGQDDDQEPESVHADLVYGTRENWAFLQTKGIRYAGKSLGWPRIVTEQNAAQLKREKRQRQADYRQRIPIEGKLGQGKNGYSLNRICAKTTHTSEAWIHSIFLVMNLLVLVRHSLVPEIILAIVAEWAGFIHRIRKNSHNPGLRILNCRIRQVCLLTF